MKSFYFTRTLYREVVSRKLHMSKFTILVFTSTSRKDIEMTFSYYLFLFSSILFSFFSYLFKSNYHLSRSLYLFIFLSLTIFSKFSICLSFFRFPFFLNNQSQKTNLLSEMIIFCELKDLQVLHSVIEQRSQWRPVQVNLSHGLYEYFPCFNVGANARTMWLRLILS